MFDNGLLKYYRDLKSENGVLSTDFLSLSESLPKTDFDIKVVEIDGKSYYVKSTNRENYPYSSKKSKYKMDSEILLSQIYSRTGIESAIYLPLLHGNRQYLISDDVKNKRVVTANAHLNSYLAGTGVRAIPFLKDNKNFVVEPENVLNENTMQQQTKMRILDTASYNTDRHPLNFFYKLSHSLQEPPKDLEEMFSGLKSPKISSQIMRYYRNLLPNIATDVVSIDYGASGTIMSDIAQDKQNSDTLYENDFGYVSLSRENMINEIETNEQLAQLIDKKDLAEVIGSINPSLVAQDVKDTIGYEVDSSLVDILSKSYDDMAETLLK